MRIAAALLGLLGLTAAFTGIRMGGGAPDAAAARPAGLLPGEVLERAEFALIDARYAPPDAEVIESTGLATFTTNGRWADSALPVPVRYVFATDPRDLTGFGSLLWAMRRWESVGGQKLRLAYTGAFATGPTVTCTDRDRDGFHTVSFNRLSGHLLGTTCVFFAVAPGTQVRRILEFDLELTTEVPWSISDTTDPGTFDLPTVMLHEMGHAIGLGHSPAAGSVMQEALAPGTQFRVPSADDQEGLLSLYADATAKPVTPIAVPPAAYSKRRLPALAHE